VIIPSTGVRITKTENPARALGPKLDISKAIMIAIWMGVVYKMWKNVQQASIRETSVEM
jgi:hypothetical protein